MRHPLDARPSESPGACTGAGPRPVLRAGPFKWTARSPASPLPGSRPCLRGRAVRGAAPPLAAPNRPPPARCPSRGEPQTRGTNRSELHSTPARRDGGRISSVARRPRRTRPGRPADRPRCCQPPVCVAVAARLQPSRRLSRHHSVNGLTWCRHYHAVQSLYRKFRRPWMQTLLPPHSLHFDFSRP